MRSRDSAERYISAYVKPRTGPAQVSTLTERKLLVGLAVADTYFGSWHGLEMTVAIVGVTYSV